MKNNYLVLLVIILSAFLTSGVSEYWIISTYVPAANPLDEIQGISETVSSMLPQIGYALALSTAWFIFCQKYYSSEKQTCTVEHSIEQQLLQTEREVIAARQGTTADSMFFTGIIAALFGMGSYASLVFLEASPVRLFLI